MTRVLHRYINAHIYAAKGKGAGGAEGISETAIHVSTFREAAEANEGLSGDIYNRESESHKLFI